MQMKKNIVLVAARDLKGLFRVPPWSFDLPGHYFDIVQEMGLKDQIIAQASIALGHPELAGDLVFKCTFDQALVIGIDEYLLHLVFLNNEKFSVPSTWKTIPELLRSMKKNKNRVPYLLAFQVLAGSDTDQIDALEMDDEVKNRIKDQLDPH